MEVLLKEVNVFFVWLKTLPFFSLLHLRLCGLPLFFFCGLSSIISVLASTRLVFNKLLWAPCVFYLYFHQSPLLLFRILSPTNSTPSSVSKLFYVSVFATHVTWFWNHSHFWRHKVYPQWFRLGMLKLRIF
jgi:hypothetical protein